MLAWLEKFRVAVYDNLDNYRYLPIWYRDYEEAAAAGRKYVEEKDRYESFAILKRFFWEEI